MERFSSHGFFDFGGDLEMKKVLGILAALLFAAIVVWTGVFLYRKSQVKPVVYQTASPVRTDIVRKTVATGAVVPRKEVQIKPLISGIIEELYVEPGALVKQGDLIAKVRVIPNMVELSSSESRVNKAKIALADAERDYLRNKNLVEDGTISAADFQRAEIAWEQAKEDMKGAQDNLDIVRKGTSVRMASASTTVVKATIGGTVLEVPLEVGNSVIESNNFNDGTTIAAIADLDDLIFKGKVDESEVGKIKPGMDLELTIGALPENKVHAILERIAPKGVEENGAIQFEIRAALAPQKGLLIRANYSASADIVLEKREQVLAIDEGLLQFEDEKPYVEVETAAQAFERRDIETGISDGIQIEVVSGLTETDKIKNPNTDAAPAPKAP
jgi:HlyD family secretion protein